MPDQNRLEAFNEAKPVAEAKRQQAIHQAQRAFDRAMAQEIDRHKRRYEDAREAFDAVKDKPDHPLHNEARTAFEVIRGTNPDHSAAYAELERAIREADEAYHAEVARLGREHGATVG